MRRSFPWLLTILLLSGSARLDTIPYTPPRTAATWLTIQPYAALKWCCGDHAGPAQDDLLRLSPGRAGDWCRLYFFPHPAGPKSRLWWGIAWCCGARARCGGDQLRGVQLGAQVRGAAGLRLDELVGGAVPHPLGGERGRHAGGRGVRLRDRQARRWLNIYAAANLAVYGAVRADRRAGSLKFLISFELLILFAAPTIRLFFILNGWRYVKFGTPGSGAAARVGLAGADPRRVFRLPMSGTTGTWWARGVWFSENDVLHIGLIVWMIYLAWVVAPRVRDAE